MRDKTKIDAGLLHNPFAPFSIRDLRLLTSIT